MTRKEHIDWCKLRAMEILESGDCEEAVTSMVSDLGKHDETKSMQQFAFMFRISPMASDPPEVRKFIKGFN